MSTHDAKPMGSIADFLLNYVSTAPIHDTNYEIAVGMIQNYSSLYKKSCEEVAEICFVSKASISRFCKFIGYNNYKEFQEALSFRYEMGTQYTKSFRTMLKSDKQHAMESYRDALVANIYSILSDEMLIRMEEIVDILYESENIVYFSHHFLWNVGQFFQSRMMLMNKYVRKCLKRWRSAFPSNSCYTDENHITKGVKPEWEMENRNQPLHSQRYPVL
ncbi:MurR/RpiR family transcriptional regulator [Schaedlerella arabinosiphila]|uniref:MurR/RpiR family transcriptional regulator n=1 Tax=Schaedlerella arabinosiphila TaxID=2044587 RepID=A0A9X5H620_9FIRM|nr:MurR/RpiR family transcriptional regulator [Schaedlerella arabinosiphila]KAI4444086.1 hypothetical protein C824_000515 [Schaedlerella arabinosiphila]NDO70627.1 MurR/RpiR family transcriptional regulator [Schaedlerella arabinosiphila]